MVSKHSSSRDVRELRELRGLEFIEEEVELGEREGRKGGEMREGRGETMRNNVFLHGSPIGYLSPFLLRVEGKDRPQT